MAYIAVFLPLLGAFLAGRFGTAIGKNFLTEKQSMLISTSFICIAALASIYLFMDVAIGGNAYILPLFNWIHSGALNITWALKMDTLTVIMLIVVNLVSAMVHIYSIGYMAHDPHKARFFSYLSLFTFMMLMLVTSDNLLQLFFGWEGVGLMSYLLINFWYLKDSANRASIKAFLVNRVGDFGFSLGIVTIFALYHSLDYTVIFASAAAEPNRYFEFLGFQIHGLSLACLLLFSGALAKSAQLGLHTWLPDAMEGPTPVSALIHAATMVTAGVFLVARLSPLFEFAPAILDLIAFIGALTALVAATIGLVQYDIKRVIAYSTMSQLGYMFFALGVSAYSTAIFHLMTHAFFKALLFLSAGSVIHAFSDEQDMRKMGGVWKMIPMTYALIWIGSLALAGIPFFAGYYSKDMILEVAFASGSTIGQFAFVMGILAAILTAFYSWRLILMTFHGKSRSDEKVFAHVHESSWVMLAPLCVLAIGAIFAGYVGFDWFVGEHRTAFWGNALFVLEDNEVLHLAHHVPLWVKILPLAAGVLGIIFAYYLYYFREPIAVYLKKQFLYLHLFLSEAYYFNQLYDFLFVKSSFKIGNMFWKKGDQDIIDRFGPNGMRDFSKLLGQRFHIFQSGYLYHYAFSIIFGLVVFSLWFAV